MDRIQNVQPNRLYSYNYETQKEEEDIYYTFGKISYSYDYHSYNGSKEVGFGKRKVTLPVPTGTIWGNLRKKVAPIKDKKIIATLSELKPKTLETYIKEGKSAQQVYDHAEIQLVTLLSLQDSTLDSDDKEGYSAVCELIEKWENLQDEAVELQEEIVYTAHEAS